MENKISKDEYDELASIVEVETRSLYNHDVTITNTRKVNATAFYTWEARLLETARVATEKAARVRKAAFHVVKGDVSNE